MNNKALHTIAFALLVIGGLNWLLVGLLELDLVALIFGTTIVADIVYILVGLAAIVELFIHSRR